MPAALAVLVVWQVKANGRGEAIQTDEADDASQAEVGVSFRTGAMILCFWRWSKGLFSFFLAANHWLRSP